MKKAMILSGIVAVALLASAVPFLARQDSLRRTLNDAGDNRGELETVLNHYKFGKKRRAARFLIANMDSHYCNTGPAIDFYKSKMLDLLENPEMRDSVVRYSKMYESEAAEKFPSGVRKEYDHQTLSSGFLIENIDDAFETWRNSPWKRTYLSAISAITFCLTGWARNCRLRIGGTA